MIKHCWKVTTDEGDTLFSSKKKAKEFLGEQVELYSAMTFCEENIETDWQKDKITVYVPRTSYKETIVELIKEKIL